jgi:hypothetical protein
MCEYDLITIMPTKKNLFLTIDFIIIRVEITFVEKINTLEQVCHVFIKKQFQCPWGSQGV